MSDYTTLKEELYSLQEGESLVFLKPEGNGYFLMIGDSYVEHCWAVTQEEVNQLAILCDKYKTKDAVE